eukprot:gene12495-16762_t
MIPGNKDNSSSSSVGSIVIDVENWDIVKEWMNEREKNDGDEDACVKEKQLAFSICPEDWTTSWKEQRENGTFLGIQEKEAEKKSHH